MRETETRSSAPCAARISHPPLGIPLASSTTLHTVLLQPALEF